mmetsp:Transcript_10470/g.38565  ORF Transcript_10470/g.38565 Transcript_10470/m.38565 type:complete len:313 (-) Transcript_10470:50-988(-)
MAGPPSGTITHTVQRTDTLAGLAVRYNTEIGELKALNKLMSDMSLHARATILIPNSSQQSRQEDNTAGFEDDKEVPQALSNAMEALREHYGLSSMRAVSGGLPEAELKQTHGRQSPRPMGTRDKHLALGASGTAATIMEMARQRSPGTSNGSASASSGAAEWDRDWNDVSVEKDSRGEEGKGELVSSGSGGIVRRRASGEEPAAPLKILNPSKNKAGLTATGGSMYRESTHAQSRRSEGSTPGSTRLSASGKARESPRPKGLSASARGKLAPSVSGPKDAAGVARTFLSISNSSKVPGRVGRRPPTAPGKDD